jgi:protein-S-isoprenylcysteine O-methyltransferase Ste14
MSASVWIRTAVWIVFTAALLFGGAGRLDIPFFWLILAFYAGFMIAGLLKLDPELIQERIRPGGRKPARDVLLAALPTLAQFLLAGLDVRFDWSRVPLPVQTAGLALMVGSWIFVAWAMWVNRYFSSVIRLQQDRGQVVVSSGPYAWIRHPGYVGGLVNSLAIAPALGSWVALAPSPILVGFFIYRTIREDRTLRQGLPGYTEYAARVPYRWIPGVW